MSVNEDCDFLIAGTGFGGSLTALILHRLGYRVLLFDVAAHPRFSIGESSTPLADACLRELCQRYELHALAPLCSYGSARREAPQLTVGLKRGFSYFRHLPGQAYAADAADAAEQLLVMAAHCDELSDTHWLRSSVDSHFADQVRQAGIPLWEKTRFDSLVGADPWQVKLHNATGEQRTVTSKFLIDASGRASVLASQLRAQPMATSSRLPSRSLLTSSRALYGHFRGVAPWKEMLDRAQIPRTLHPFDCDHAAVHHLIEHGWMWQLRFDNDVTSVGFAIEPGYYAGRACQPAAEQFQQLLQTYPTLSEQLSGAQCVAPEGGIRATKRLQYLELPAAGEAWACLPSAVGFVDPLHSTGIAHTLYSVRELTNAIARFGLAAAPLRRSLQRYALRMENELRMIDRLVFLGYATLHNFEAFVASCMLYFATATFAEAGRSGAGVSSASDMGFLNAENPGFVAVVERALELAADCGAERVAWAEYPRAIEQWIQPYNLVGLCDRSLNHMYGATAAARQT